MIPISQLAEHFTEALYHCPDPQKPVWTVLPAPLYISRT
jgi:hypothetical protein